jgi:hypothetical protein
MATRSLRGESASRTTSATAAAGSEPRLSARTANSSTIVVAPTVSARSGQGSSPSAARTIIGQAQMSRNAASALR